MELLNLCSLISIIHIEDENIDKYLSSFPVGSALGGLDAAGAK